MNPVRSVARRLLSQPTRHRIWLIYQRAVDALRKPLSVFISSFLISLVRLLPLRTGARVKEYLLLTGKLDYERATIRINVDSEIEATMRLHSCRKEPETIGWLESSVAPGDVVYDIGANVGAYALVVDRHTNGESIVYAFEPGFANFAQLCRNILLNGCQSRIVPFAVSLSDATGMASFHYSSIGPGAAMHTVGQPTGRTEYTQPVLTYRLDDFVEQFGILPPNHIKLDVDGSELAILHGAERLLSSDRLRTLLVEHPVGHDGALGITAFLEQHGLRRLSTHRHGTQTTDAANSVFGRSHPSPPGF